MQDFKFSVDVGSTETRTKYNEEIFRDKAGSIELDEDLVEDYREYVEDSNGDALNLQLYNDVYYVIGKDTACFGGMPSRLTSSLGKSEQEQYVNTIVLTCMKYAVKHREENEDNFRITATVAIPSEDKGQRVKLKEKLNRDHIVVFPILNEEFAMHLDVEFVFEQKAAVQANQELFGEGWSVLVDLGGRNLGGVILLDGQVVPNTYYSTTSGGFSLKVRICEKLRNILGRDINPAQFEINKQMRSQGRVMDISEITNKCVKDFSKTVLNTIETILDSSKTPIRLDEVGVVVLTGRAGNGTDDGNTLLTTIGEKVHVVKGKELINGL